jgi:UDP-2,3-diacylglucosamine hydrolase
MNTPVYFISDNHFQFSDFHNEQNRRNLLFNLFLHIKSTGGTLVIGGDFLDFWFDYGKEQINGYESVFNALEDLNSKGIKIHYVLGNHDFWDFGYFGTKFGAIVHHENLEFCINNEHILVTHGDGLLKNDYGYRLMKKIIRHPISIFIFGLLQTKIGCKLASKVSKTSRHFNDGYQENEIAKNDITEFAHSQFVKKVNTVLVGHYHQTGINKYQENRLIWMGDWIKYFTVTIRDNEGWKQLNWENESPFNSEN